MRRFLLLTVSTLLALAVFASAAQARTVKSEVKPRSSEAQGSSYVVRGNVVSKVGRCRSARTVKIFYLRDGRKPKLGDTDRTNRRGRWVLRDNAQGIPPGFDGISVNLKPKRLSSSLTCSGDKVRERRQ